MFSQSRDIFASQQHLRDEYRGDFDKVRVQDGKSKDFYGKDSTDLASSVRERNSDLNSDLFDSKYAFDGSNGKRDPFGMTRDVSPKSRDSFGMPSPRDFGVIPNTRDSFTVARQSFSKLDQDMDRRSSVASTHRTDKMERIEIEEWPEFLKPVLPPADKPEIEKVQEMVNTKLYPQTSNAHFTYNRIMWTLRVKKEVFAPNETLNSPLALHLVFCQVAYDVLATSSIRITKEDRQSMLKMLDNYGVTLDNLQSTQHKITIKKNIVDMAKQWPLYFARIFPVSVSFPVSAPFSQRSKDRSCLGLSKESQASARGLLHFSPPARIGDRMLVADRPAASGDSTRGSVASRASSDQAHAQR